MPGFGLEGVYEIWREQRQQEIDALYEGFEEEQNLREGVPLEIWRALQ